MAVELMTEEKKRNMGIVSFIPPVATLCVVLYHVFVFRRHTAAEGTEGNVLTTATARHLDTLTWLYGITGILSLAVLIYFIVHLLKIKNMTGGTKAVWAVVLAALAPLSFPLFWLLQVKREPRKLDVKKDIR